MQFWLLSWLAGDAMALALLLLLVAFVVRFRPPAVAGSPPAAAGLALEDCDGELCW